MMKKCVWIALIFFVLFCWYLFIRDDKTTIGDAKTISIGNTNYNIEIAQTNSEITAGLSGRSSLDKNKGMLFIFDSATRPVFWMKSMMFPLDLIWITDAKISDLSKNLQPADKNLNDKDISLFHPAQAITEVLEINAGEIDKNEFYIGQPVRIH